MAERPGKKTRVSRRRGKAWRSSLERVPALTFRAWLFGFSGRRGFKYFDALFDVREGLQRCGGLLRRGRACLWLVGLSCRRRRVAVGGGRRLGLRRGALARGGVQSNSFEEPATKTCEPDLGDFVDGSKSLGQCLQGLGVLAFTSQRTPPPPTPIKARNLIASDLFLPLCGSTERSLALERTRWPHLCLCLA